LAQIYYQQSARQPGDIISERRATSSRNQRATSSESASGNRSPDIEPIHAPAANEPTRPEHYWCFDDDGSRLTQARGEQEDTNGAEDKAD